jgi:tRNA A-37 threonylcarbamoyl transferase component Bud32
MTLQSRYSILRKIADGGTAEIFLAKQHGAQGFEKTVVLKRIFASFYADPQFRHMLVDEAHIAMTLNHSNIVQVLDLGEVDGRYFLALELVDGWTLDRTLKRAQAAGVPFPPALALYVTAEVCRALGYAHAKARDGKPLGIVHRDVSPHNVLLSNEGECKLTDFGIAQAQNRKEKSLGNMIKGKISFMSPEQASGTALDSRSDLFSLGTMLYAMITRRLPFDAATDYETLMLVKSGDYLPPETARPGLNPELYRVIRKAMSKSPDDRYQKAEEMLVDVEQVMRLAFRPVGQTELQRWLADLSAKDGVPPLTRDLTEAPAAAAGPARPAPAKAAPAKSAPAKPAPAKPAPAPAKPLPASAKPSAPPKRASGGTDAGQESGVVLDLEDAIEVVSAAASKPPSPPLAGPTEVNRHPPDMSGVGVPAGQANGGDESVPDLSPAPWYRGRSVFIAGAVALVLLFVVAVKGFSGGKRTAGAATVAVQPAPVPPPAAAPTPATPTAPIAPAPVPPVAAPAPVAEAMPAPAGTPDAAAAKAPAVAVAPTPEPEAEPAAEAPEAAAAAPAKGPKPHRGAGEASSVSVTFKTEPEGAEVATRTHAYGTTPHAVKLARGSAYDLTFTKVGYAPATKHYVAPAAGKGAQTVRVSLKKLPEPPKKSVEARAPPPATPAPRKGWFAR